MVEDDEITIGHVGDSRLYLIWNGAIRKLTCDHSPVGEDEDAGELTRSAKPCCTRAATKCFATWARGRARPEETEFIEIRRCRFHPDAAILLCSDGLTDQLTAAEVREIVERYEGDAARVARELVEAANRAGGRDNITALFVAGPEFTGARARHGHAAALCHHAAARAASALFTGRVAFLTYGLLLGMLVWAVLRAGGGHDVDPPDASDDMKSFGRLGKSMTDVYLAIDTVENRKAALKLIRPGGGPAPRG